MSKELKVFQTSYSDVRENAINGIQYAIDMARTVDLISKYGLSLIASYAPEHDIVMWTCTDVEGRFSAEGVTPAYAVDAWDGQREDSES